MLTIIIFPSNNDFVFMSALYSLACDIAWNSTLKWKFETTLKKIKMKIFPNRLCRHSKVTDVFGYSFFFKFKFEVV